MTLYKLKKKFNTDIQRIKNIIKECFDTDTIIEDKDGIYFYFIVLGKVKVNFIDNKLSVSTEKTNLTTNTHKDSDIISANSKFRKFLNLATGYTAKERIKNMKIENEK